MVSPIQYKVNSSVTNAEEGYFIEILDLWKGFLGSDEFVSSESAYWATDEMPYPAYSMIQLLLDLRSFQNEQQEVQCTVLGLIPVENDHYLLRCMFTQIDDSTQMVDLKFITTVYAKKVNEAFKLVNSTQYHKMLWSMEKYGDVTYYIHPEHAFDRAKATQMDTFNKEIAGVFEAEPIAFDYFVSNNTSQTGELLGLDYFMFSLRPVQSGGMADTNNGIIYAGNNSEYYPHEVVHLYTSQRFRGQFHSWADEGVAAYFGGSTGFVLDWHLQKLKLFLELEPDYPIVDLSELETDVPNGEYVTDFRYVIGGLMCKLIFEKEGKEGLFDLLSCGRTEEDYFNVLHDKLGVSQSDFGAFVKAELKKIDTLSEVEMKALEY